MLKIVSILVLKNNRTKHADHDFICVFMGEKKAIRKRLNNPLKSGDFSKSQLIG